MAFLAPIIVLGLVILVHEAGHFWAAKIFGVYAPRFAIGFGPALWRRRIGETEYVLGALPLGGYVRMATREDEASNALEGSLDESKGGALEQDPNAMIPFGPKPVPPDRWFESKPLWQRAVIMLAGVTMNIVLAMVVLISVLAIYGRPTLKTPIAPVVGSVVSGMPAAKAGLAPGDSLISVDGVPAHTWTDMVRIVSSSIGRELTFVIGRDGKTIEYRITPQAAKDTDETGAVKPVGRVGLSARQDIVTEHVSLAEAAPGGVRWTWNMAAGVVGVLKGLVTGTVAVKELGGVIRIAQTSVAEARRGLENVLTLIAFLSVNLAVLNLVPIPLLDGGQLLLQVAETVKGSAFSDRTREWIARAGLAAIALLFIVVTFNDIKSLIGLG
ncbi:MAG TPA: RIP metalloprotease RseP [Gemmatimonadaceae bacterium]|nr:RIP metalloprotease RseP [Gemmatimonadaceae bacterium]